MKLTKKIQSGEQSAVPAESSGIGLFGKAVNRRTFLRHSGVAAGGATVASIAAPTMIKKVRAAETSPKAEVDTEIKLSVCTHC